MSDKIKILFLAANPIDVKYRLRLDEEFKQIRKKLRGGEKRDCFDLVAEWAVTAEDLQEILLTHQPHILHFSGHGSKTQGIVLEDKDGKMCLLDKRAFANLLKALKENIRIVVLNACYAKDQGNQLKEIVDFTIGMNKVIGDEAAIVFASHFYQGLAFGKSVQTAFELGRGQLDLSKIPESSTPQLLVRFGVDPTQSLFVDRKADREARSNDGESDPSSSGNKYESHQEFRDADSVTGINLGRSKS